MTKQKSNKRNTKKKSTPKQPSSNATQQSNRKSGDRVGSVGNVAIGSGGGSVTSLKVQNLDLSLGSLTISSPPSNKGRSGSGKDAMKKPASSKSSASGSSWEAVSPTPSCRYSSVESGGTGNKKTNRTSAMMNTVASLNRSINLSDGNNSNCSSITTESGGDSPGKKKQSQSGNSPAIPAYATVKSNRNKKQGSDQKTKKNKKGESK